MLLPIRRPRPLHVWISVVIIVLLSVWVFLTPSGWALQTIFVANLQQRIWYANQPSHYRYQLHHHVFAVGLLENSPRPNMNITIRDGRVIAVTEVDTGLPISAERVKAAPAITFDDLFLFVDTATAVDKLSVRYNRRYGYPEIVSIDHDQQIFDDEEAFEVTNFELLP